MSEDKYKEGDEVITLHEGGRVFLGECGGPDLSGLITPKTDKQKLEAMLESFGVDTEPSGEDIHADDIFFSFDSNGKFITLGGLV